MIGKDYISIASDAVISARGGDTKSSVYGAGSGGGVLMVAPSVTLRGLISVRGGNSYTRTGAGGGGRISIMVINLRRIPSIRD